MPDMSAAEGNRTLNHEEDIVAIQPRTMQVSAEGAAEACLDRVGHRVTQPRPQARYPSVDAVHIGGFEEESKREDSGLSTKPLVRDASPRRLPDSESNTELGNSAETLC